MTGIRDTFTFFNLYDNNATVQTSDDSNITTSEGAPVFMVGGSCPERTEAVSIVAPFLYSLQVYVDLLKVWQYNTLNVALHGL